MIHTPHHDNAENERTNERDNAMQCNAMQGVLDRETSKVHLFERGARTKKATDMAEVDLHDPELPDLITEELYDQLMEDVEMLDG